MMLPASQLASLATGGPALTAALGLRTMVFE